MAHEPVLVGCTAFGVAALLYMVLLYRKLYKNEIYCTICRAVDFVPSTKFATRIDRTSNSKALVQ